MDNDYLYESRNYILTKTEKEYMNAIKDSLPPEYILLVQQNLSTLVNKTDNSKFRNELFRNIDFVIVDNNYKILFCIEVNDNTHTQPKRIERDKKVKMILEESGIPLVVFWTKYGINKDYIKTRILETINSLPVERIHHFKESANNQENEITNKPTENNKVIVVKKQGCYIATCIYNSYDCPEVWTLRRFRDFYLNEKTWGKLFIKVYYSISPLIVKIFGNNSFFRKITKSILDKFVGFLNKKGYLDDKYEDLY